MISPTEQFREGDIIVFSNRYFHRIYYLLKNIRFDDDLQTPWWACREIEIYDDSKDRKKVIITTITRHESLFYKDGSFFLQKRKSS